MSERFFELALIYVLLHLFHLAHTPCMLTFDVSDLILHPTCLERNQLQVKSYHRAHQNYFAKLTSYSIRYSNFTYVYVICVNGNKNQLSVGADLEMCVHRSYQCK